MKRFLLSVMLMVVLFPLTMKADEIIVGEATDARNVAPFVNTYPYSWLEMVYEASEIGKACNIGSIAFEYSSGPTLATDEIRIYLAETTKSVFAANSEWTAEDELTLVYSGTGVILGDDAWETFEFDVPFEYDGEKNLAVVVAKAAENLDFYNWDLTWKCYNATNSILFTASDTDASFAQYPVADGLAMYGKKPVMKLIEAVEIIEPTLPAAPTNLSAVVEQDVDGYNYKYRITMMWDAVENADLYDVYVNTANNQDFYLGFSTGTSYIVGTNEETTIEFYVKTIIDDVESESSEIYTIIVEDNAVEELLSSFEIYPNPATDILRIYSEERIEEVVVYDVYGRQQVNMTTRQQGEVTFDLSDFNNGVYFVKVKFGSNEVMKKVVKQ